MKPSDQIDEYITFPIAVQEAATKLANALLPRLRRDQEEREARAVGSTGKPNDREILEVSIVRKMLAALATDKLQARFAAEAGTDPNKRDRKISRDFWKIDILGWCSPGEVRLLGARHLSVAHWAQKMSSPCPATGALPMLERNAFNAWTESQRREAGPKGTAARCARLRDALMAIFEKTERRKERFIKGIAKQELENFLEEPVTDYAFRQAQSSVEEILGRPLCAPGRPSTKNRLN